MTVNDIHRVIGKENLEFCKVRENLFGLTDSNTDFEAKVQKSMELYGLRNLFIQKFGFSIPTYELVVKLKKLSPLVEIGAGTGMLSYLVKNAGGHITPYDTHPPRLKTNRYRFSKEFLPVLKGDHRSLAKHPNSTLLLCWPPYNTSMGYKCLSARTWRGKHLVVIGESNGGCTADDKFFNKLTQDWELLEEIRIPQFPGIHDYAAVYKRLRK